MAIVRLLEPEEMCNDDDEMAFGMYDSNIDLSIKLDIEYIKKRVWQEVAKLKSFDDLKILEQNEYECECIILQNVGKTLEKLFTAITNDYDSVTDVICRIKSIESCLENVILLIVLKDIVKETQKLLEENKE